MKNRIILSYILGSILFVSAHSAFAGDIDGFLLLNRDHSRPITALAMKKQENLAFTADAGGLLKVWDLKLQTLVQSIRIGNNPIRSIASNPSNNEIALVEQQGLNQYRLSIWNWKEKRFTFARSLDSPPIQMNYSPEGGYLVLSLDNPIQTLRLYDSKNAKEFALLDGELGKIGFFLVSDSEVRIMVYENSTGIIKYIDIDTGNIVHETQTEKELRNWQILADRRYAIASKNNELFVVDIVSGATRLRNALPKQVQNRSILSNILPIKENRFYLVLSHSIFQQLLEVEIVLGRNTFIEYHLETELNIDGTTVLFATGNSGSIFASTSTPEIFGNNKLGVIENGRHYFISTITTGSIHNVLVLDNWVYFQTDWGISRINIGLIQKPKNRKILISNQVANPPPLKYMEHLELPFTGSQKMELLGPKEMLIWKEGTSTELFIFNSDTSEFQELKINLGAELTKLRVGNRYLLLLDSDGLLYLVSRERQFETVLTFRNPGILDFLELSDGDVILGSERVDFLSSNLIKIHPETKKFSTLNTEDDLVYSFELARGKNEYYSLGELNREGKIFATLRRQFENGNSELLFQLPDLNPLPIIKNVPDNSSLLVYTGVQDGLNIYQQGNFQRVDIGTLKPIGLHGNQQFFASINENGSLVFWDKQSLEPIVQIHIIQPELSQVSFLLFYPEYSYLVLQDNGRRADALSQIIASNLRVVGNSGRRPSQITIQGP